MLRRDPCSEGLQSVQLYTNELESVLESLARPEVDMATVDVPTAPPGVPEGANDAQTAAALVQHYGPRGAIRLLDTAVSQASSLRLEHLMFEDYVADIMDVWHDDRTECVKRLATLPVAPSQAATYAPMLAEAMFGQLLRLPTPRHRTVAYLGVMVDLCRLKTVPFSRSMSGCMRELFKLTGLLDPVLLERVAEYLAYHLAAFDFIWPWKNGATWCRHPR